MFRKGGQGKGKTAEQEQRGSQSTVSRRKVTLQLAGEKERRLISCVTRLFKRSLNGNKFRVFTSF